MALKPRPLEQVRSRWPYSCRRPQTFVLGCRRPPHSGEGAGSLFCSKEKNRSVTDNIQGLLISDFASKVLTGLFREDLEEKYEKFIPKDKVGCAKKRGNIYATHIVRTFIDNCNFNALSFFVFFIDVSNAFDFAIREILFGWRQAFNGNKASPYEPWPFPRSCHTAEGCH